MPDLPSPLVEPTLRPDLPTYPVHTQLIRVTEAKVPGPSGVAQTAGSSVVGPTLYVAFTQQLRTSGLLPRDREPCLADDMNGLGLVPGYYLGRLAQSFNSLPVYEIGAGAGDPEDGAAAFALTIDETPTSGLYSALLYKKNPNGDGSLVDTGELIWLNEANSAGRLHPSNIYECTKTGFRSGRDVYTLADYYQIIANEGQTQLVLRVISILFGPDSNWVIADAAITPRVGLIKRVLTVREETTSKTTFTWQMDFSPATAWDVTATADGHATIERLLNIREGTTTRTTHTWQVDFDSTDFDVTATATGHATVQTEGFTGTFYVLTNCVAGVLKKKLLTFTRGLLKTVGAEIDL